MNPKYILSQIEMDRYARALCRYLNEHKFNFPDDISVILTQADNASSAFEEARRNGLSVPAASAEANMVLFQNVGESEYETVWNMLEDNFGDTIDLRSEEWLSFWTEKILDECENLFEGCEMLHFGISAADIDTMNDILIGRIKEYFESYGL